MLAIFEGRVAKRPACMLMPHEDSVASLKDDFLVNHFISLYHDSIAISSEASFTFVYSLGASSSSHLERYHFAQMDGVYCMYQGFIKDIDAVKRDFHISGIDDEGIVMIRAFRILRQLGQRIPKKVVENLFGNCISVFHEVPSKLIVLAAGSYHNLPIYWGIDARFNLVISSNENVVEKACGSVQTFLIGQVYACCKGRTGHEALFLNKHLRYKVDFTDKYFPVSRPIETISKMILQADKDMSNWPYAQIWEPPLPDFVKVNTDVVKFRDGMLGVGILIRDSKGDVIYAASRKLESKIPESEEFEAFIEGFYTAVGFKIQRCIFESVHLNLEKVDRNGLSAKEIIEMMIRNIREPIEENLSEFSVSFVSSNANKAAYRLALRAKTDEYNYWDFQTPECIADIVESERPKIDTIASAFLGLEI